MRLVLAALLFAAPLAAKAPTTCNLPDDYARALCSYQQRNFAEAAAGFHTIVDKGEKDPTTIHAMYFLARTEMKQGRFDEAAPIFIRIYDMAPAFYAEWNCDYLLGECRKAMGKD